MSTKKELQEQIDRLEQALRDLRTQKDQELRRLQAEKDGVIRAKTEEVDGWTTRTYQHEGQLQRIRDLWNQWIVLDKVPEKERATVVFPKEALDQLLTLLHP